MRILRLVIGLSLAGFSFAPLAFAPLAMASDPGRAVKVGDETMVRVETPHPVPAVEAGAAAWRDVFTWPRASYIAVHFERFDLAPGERVVVSTPDDAYSFTFEGEGKPLTGGTFWATHVPGDTCIVTYYGSGAKTGFGYVVDRFAHGHEAPPRPRSEFADAVESICGADDSNWAKCYQVSEPAIYDQSRAIARIIINGIEGCTAWLVGCEGHIMTNQHCIATQSDASNTDYEFMAEGATCATNCATFGGCPGTIVASSGTLVKANAPKDYALVQLPVNVTPTYGYFKMRDGAPVIGERIYVPGHPGAWGKRFAVASTDGTHDPSGFCQVWSQNEPACASGGPLDVGYFCDTQGGSSGSPVVATSDGRVVALHHCADCPNRGVPIQSIINDLRATNNLPNCAILQLAGTVDLTASFYPCSGSAGIVVRDDSLVGNTTQNVTIVSSTETTLETVTLTATATGSNTFTGSIALTSSPPVHGDGALSVTGGDTITVTYIDADDGSGGMNVPRTDNASVDCIPPGISNVAVTAVTGSGATLTWTTNEPADSSAHYGTSTPPSNPASVPALVTSHAVPVGGLAECTSYFFDVASHDAAGNLASDNNGGAYYSFSTVKNTQPTYASTDTPISIPDNNATGATSTISVPYNDTVLDVEVKVNITHTFDGDLKLLLIPPSGSPITLSNYRGSDGHNFTNTVFDDQASTPIASGSAPFTGSFQPDNPLSSANGINAAGAWKLRVIDSGLADTGTIDNWSLTLTFAAGVCSPSIVYASSAPADSCTGGGSGGGNGTVDPGEDVVLPVSLRNNGTVTLTNVSAVLSTSAPDVTVTRGSAAYPNIAAPGVASSIAPHFAFTVGTGVACGTLIDFTIVATADQGSWTRAFSLRVGAPGTTTTTYPSTDVPKTIADNATVTSSLTVSDTASLLDLDVGVTLSHTYDSDLILTLIGPNAAFITLARAQGGSGDNFTGTVFDDEATTPIGSGTPPFTGRFQPEQPLSVLDGIPGNGTWRLQIQDTATGDTGILTAWSLMSTTPAGFVCSGCNLSPPALAPVMSIWSSGSKSSLQWESIPGATFYIVYRGIPSDLSHLLDAGVDSCRRYTTTGTVTGSVLGETPASGSLFWYLVRAANGAGQGPAGDATAGPRSQESSGECP